MTTEPRLNGEDAEDLVGLPARVLRARLTASEWLDVTDALTTLHRLLLTGSNREVLRAVGTFDDLVPVRVRAQPGAQPTREPPDEIAHLVHDVEIATGTRVADGTDDEPADRR